MAKIPVAGKDFKLLMEKDGDYVIFGCTRGATLNINAATVDASCKDSEGWTEAVSGTKSWSVDFDGVYRIITAPDDDTNYSALEIFADLDAGTLKGVRLGPDSTGSKQFAGNGLITGLSISAPNDGEATFSGTLTGSGPLEIFTVPAP